MPRTVSSTLSSFSPRPWNSSVACSDPTIPSHCSPCRTWCAPSSAQPSSPKLKPLARQTLDLQRRVLGPEHEDTQWTLHNLGVTLRATGHRDEAEKLFRQTMAVRQRTLGPDHPDTLGSMEELAVTLDELHRYPEAADLYRKTIDAQRRILGPNHPVTASTKYNLACNAALSGRRDEALSVLRDAVEHGLPPDTAAGMRQDNDLKSLRGDPRFAALVAEAKTRESVVKSH